MNNMATFCTLLAFCGLLSLIFLASKRNIVMAIVSAGAWTALIKYLTSNPPTDFAIGSSLQQTMVIVASGAAVGILLIGIYEAYINYKERNAEVLFHINHKDSNTQPRNYSAIIEADRSRSESSGDESLEEYRARIYRKLHPRKNNQNRY